MRFVDPSVSTGGSIALNSWRVAHTTVLQAFKTGKFSQGAGDNYISTIRRGTTNRYEFIKVYCRLNVLFTYFITDTRSRRDVLKLLQGDGCEAEEPEVLTKMRALVAEVWNTPQHPWHNPLNDLTANAFKPAF